MKHKLGDKITVTEVVEGKGQWSKRKLRVPIEGIVIGTKTKFLGYTESDYETGYYFVQVGSVRVIEVAYDLNRKPLMVEIDRKFNKWYTPNKHSRKLYGIPEEK